MRNGSRWTCALVAVVGLGLTLPAAAVPVSALVKVQGQKKKSTACVNEKSEECTYVKKGHGGQEEGGCLRLVSEGQIASREVAVDVLISHHVLPKKLEMVGCDPWDTSCDTNFPFDPVWLEDAAYARFSLGNFEEQVFAKRNVSGNPLVWVSDEDDGCQKQNGVYEGVCEFVGRCKAGLTFSKIADFVAEVGLQFDVTAVEGDIGKNGPQITIDNVLLTATSSENVYVWLSKNNKNAGKYGCNDTGIDPVGCAAEVNLDINLVDGCNPSDPVPNCILYTGPGVAVRNGGTAVTGNPSVYIYYQGELLFEARYSDLKKAL